MLWFVWLIISGCQPTIFSAEKIFQVNTHGVTETQKLCYGFIGPMYEIHRMPPFEPADVLRRAEYQRIRHEARPSGEGSGLDAC